MSSIRVVNGVMSNRTKLRFMQAGSTHEADEIGVRTPDNTPVDRLGPGETGYLIAGIKDAGEARSGETVTEERRPADVPLEGYAEPKPMVFSGLYPIDGDEFTDLREALEKLRLNDASFTYEPETSGALGFGFRCGFLGLLHMEIVQQRLEREEDMDLVQTAPNVTYRIVLTTDEEKEIHSPADLPDPSALQVDRDLCVAARPNPAGQGGRVRQGEGSLKRLHADTRAGLAGQQPNLPAAFDVVIPTHQPTAILRAEETRIVELAAAEDVGAQPITTGQAVGEMRQQR